jgi:hypothetical protein
VHRSGGGIVGGSGAMGAVARFAPPDLAASWLEEALTGLARVRRSTLPGQEVRLAEHHHAESRTVLGWRGGLRLEADGGGDRGTDTFAALLELLELAGAGKYTAQGFGSVRVDTVTRNRFAAQVPAPRSSRATHRVRRNPPRAADGRAHAVAEAEEFGGTLFD